MTKHPPLPETYGADGSPSSNDAYAIGYRRPPVHTRFKPGRSGNRKGRPKRQRNVRTVVEETLNQRITIRDGNGTRSLTKLDGVVLTVINGALKGEPKALTAFITLVRSLGMTGEAPEASNSEPLTGNDDALLADFLQRHSAGSERPEDPKGDGASNLEDEGDQPPGMTPPGKGAKS